MTRHRAADAVTRPIALPRTGGSAARHRSPARGALRHGAVAVGLTGTALAAVAPTTLGLPATADALEPTTASLALSAGGQALSAPRARVSPVATAVPAASSSDLRKSSRAAASRPAAAPAGAATSPAVTDDPDGSEDPGADLDCGASGSYGGVKAPVREVGNAIACVWPGHDILGVGSRSNHSDHPSGYALDIMTTDGDAIASCLTAHRDELGISYVIWDQRINTGRGWKGMADRGGATANHEDHVHVSFTHGGGSPDVSVLRGCG